MAKTSKPSLAKTHPKIAAEALGWNPFQKTWSLRAQVRWQCPEGHHYSESIVERVKNGKGCGDCAIESSRINKLQKKKVLKGRHWTNSDPKIAKQADGWDPTKIKSDSLLVKNWKCKRKHHFQATVSQARKQNGRCCKCIKWLPKEIKLYELADSLFLDRANVVDLAKKNIDTKLHGRSKLAPSLADKVLDLLYDETGQARCKRAMRRTVLNGNRSTEMLDIYRQMNERCSSCGAMFDTQRSHECRNY